MSRPQSANVFNADFTAPASAKVCLLAEVRNDSDVGPQFTVTVTAGDQALTCVLQRWNAALTVPAWQTIATLSPAAKCKAVQAVHLRRNVDTRFRVHATSAVPSRFNLQIDNVVGLHVREMNEASATA